MKDIRGHHVGFIFDGSEDTPHHTAMLTVEPAAIMLEVPLLSPVTDPYSDWFKAGSLPSELIFRNMKHCFSLSGLRVRRHASGFLGSHAVGLIEADRIVKTGMRAPNYSTVNSLQSSLVGLASWIAPNVFSIGIEPDGENRVRKVTGVLEEKPSTPVSGVPEIQLVPHFNFREDSANLSYIFSESMNVETDYADPADWDAHLREHRKMQDLISLAFWHPCDMAVVAAKRNDDPELSVGGEGFGLTWRQAIAPEFGRRAATARIHPLSKDLRPLFTYADIGEVGLAKWFAEYEDLGQAMWVLSASLFREGGTVEVRLLQVGTALEALGYELAIRSGRLTMGKRDSTFYLAEALELVVNSTDCKLDKVLKGQTAAEWARSFNTAYKGVKHADNPLPDSLDAHYRANEGTWLARLWLARHLGFDKAKLDERQAGL